MADVRPNAVVEIEMNMARVDFASALFQGMPTDTWANKLSFNPSTWIDEALQIRRDWLALMATMGVNITISNTPIHPVSLGSPPEANPLASLILRAFEVFKAEGVGGVGGVSGNFTVPTDASGDMRRALLKAMGEADARLAASPAPVAQAASTLRPQRDIYGNLLTQ